MDERQRQRRPGAIDRANSAVNTAKNIKMAIKIGRTAGTAAEAVATSEVWAPVAIIVGVILLIIIFVVIIIVATTGGGTGLANPAPNPSPVTSIASCPVSEGTISTPSYDADPVNGHCGDSYTRAGFPCLTNSRRAKAIDVLTGGPTGKDVILPLIQGQVLQWEYVEAVPQTQDMCDTPVNGSCGLGLVFVAVLENGKNWALHLVHIQSTNLRIGDVYPSGTIVGKTLISHVHIVIGKDIQDPKSAPAGATDTRPGWLAADKDLGMCAPEPAVGGGTCNPTASYYCTPSFLQNYFPDPAVARKFSIICNRESGGKPDSINTNCGTNDYSVGLFQINLVAHCAGAYGPGRWGPQSCDNLLSESRRDVCEATLINPIANIKKAVELYNDSGFSPWSAAGACNIR